MNLKNRLTRSLDSVLLRDLTTNKVPTHTRTISPKLGILGFFGFLGLTGFLPVFTADLFPVPFGFFFFAFFGFFGFYYEGKMSNTLLDERFQSNTYRAEATAHKTALTLVLVIPLISISVLRLSTYHMLGVMIAVAGLAFGLSIFLQQYLLFRLENRE